MRKKLVVLVVLCIFINMFLPLTNVHAETNNAAKKLGRGLANVISSPFEIFKGMGDANDEDGVIAGFTWGTLQGLTKFAGRLGIGIYEIVTFPIPLPEGYGPILTDPEFFLDDEEKDEMR